MTKPHLFSPLQAGKMYLSHRIGLAPLTRMRALEPSLSPSDDTVEYYTQRATSGGLLITEATHISPESLGYKSTPGIWTRDQLTGWKKVTDSVHKKNGFISIQLWHTGRVAAVEDGKFEEHPLADATRIPGVSASARPLYKTDKSGRRTSEVDMSYFTYSTTGVSKYATPRPLRTDEIPRLIDDYRHAAANAKEAGFDCCEIHGAHGYLLDQFLSCDVNERTDKYGGSVENRSRLLFEVIDAVTDVMGEGRVALRLSPTTKGTINYHDIGYDDEIYAHVVNELNKYNLAYLLLTEPRWNPIADGDPVKDALLTLPVANERFRHIYKGVLLGGGGFTPTSAKKAVEDGIYDGITFGRWFISNPDLVSRLENGQPWNVYNRQTFYGGGREGYTDYPVYQDAVASGFKVVEQDQIGTSLSAVAK